MVPPPLFPVQWSWLVSFWQPLCVGGMWLALWTLLVSLQGTLTPNIPPKNTQWQSHAFDLTSTHTHTSSIHTQSWASAEEESKWRHRLSNRLVYVGSLWTQPQTKEQTRCGFFFCNHFLSVLIIVLFSLWWLCAQAKPKQSTGLLRPSQKPHIWWTACKNVSCQV